MERKVQFYSEGMPVVGVLGVPDDYKPGEKRAAVIFCHGFTAVKEMWLPNNAARLRAEGYVTLNFDYRYFGESGGGAPSPPIPQAPGTDIRSALTFMQKQSEGNPHCIGLYGARFWCAHLSHTPRI